jgi:S1-C subfamily serine protease
MSNTSLISLSQELADRTAEGARSVVQVSGGRRPASGVVHGPDTIVTTARAVGREDGLKVRLPDDVVVDAELAGWDPSSSIAVLRSRSPIDLPAPALASNEVRTGEIVLALARSWSNAVTASAGLVAVVGGPLRTGRRQRLERVIRITAPMHEGFAGGAVLDSAGHLAGIATASAIRGYGVVIPAAIAWASVQQILAGRTGERGFLGVAVQPVELPASQQPEGRERALLVVGVTTPSPAEAAGLHVGDVLLEADGSALESADQLLEILSARIVGQSIVARILRAGAAQDLTIVIASRS